MLDKHRLFSCDLIIHPFHFKMGQYIIAVILKAFDVGCKMWHFTAVFTVYLTKTQPAQIFGCFCHYMVQTFKNCNIFTCESRLVQEGHLLLILYNSVHPSERELVITGLQGALTEFCFREWHTRSCFVFAKWATSEVERRNNEKTQWEVSSVV